MLAWAFRSHTAPARVGFLAMCRGKVERNKSEVDIVPVSQDYGRRMCRCTSARRPHPAFRDHTGQSHWAQQKRSRDRHLPVRPKMCDWNKWGAYKGEKYRQTQSKQTLDYEGTTIKLQINRRQWYTRLMLSFVLLGSGVASAPERKRLPEDVPPFLVGIGEDGEPEPTCFGLSR